MRHTKTLVRSAVAGLASLVATNLEAASSLWGDIFSSSAGTTIQFDIQNDDPGTSYTAFSGTSSQELINNLYLSNQDTYGSISEMLNATDANGQNLIRFGINDSSDVYSGWISDIDDNGNVHLTKDPNNPFAESWNSGQTLLSYVFIDSDLYAHREGGADNFQLTENTQGLIDSALDTYGTNWSTSPDWIPICEPTSMVLRGLRAIRLLSSTNQSTSISLDIEPSSYSYPGSTNIRFQIAVTTNLADNSSWVTNAPVYNVTGAVTRVTVTNSSLHAFLKVIKQ